MYTDLGFVLVSETLVVVSRGRGKTGGRPTHHQPGGLMSARDPVVRVMEVGAAEGGSPIGARGRPVERTLSDQRRSPRRLPPFTAPDVSDAVASLLQLPSRMVTSDEASATSVESGSSPSLTSVVSNIVPPTDQLPQNIKSASASGTTPSAQARHNATERRRVHNLKCAYMELDEVIRSRPDLVLVKPVPDESGGRKRTRSTDRNEDGGSSRPPAAP